MAILWPLYWPVIIKYGFGKNNATIHRCETCKDIPLLDDGTAIVGTYKTNPFNLYDVHGNVMEWVADCGHKTNSPETSYGKPRKNGNCEQHIMKDGSWWNNVKFIHASVRGSAADGTEYKSSHLGFRVAISNKGKVSISPVSKRSGSCNTGKERKAFEYFAYKMNIRK